MAINIPVTMKGKEPVDMEIEGEYTFEEIIEGLAANWDVPAKDYVLLVGTRVLEGKATVSEAGLKNTDTLVFVAKKDLTAAKKEAPPVIAAPASDLAPVLKWLHDNPGLNPQNLKVVSDDKKQQREIVFEDSVEKRKYKVKLNANGKVKEYKPIK